MRRGHELDTGGPLNGGILTGKRRGRLTRRRMDRLARRLDSMREELSEYGLEDLDGPEDEDPEEEE